MSKCHTNYTKSPKSDVSLYTKARKYFNLITISLIVFASSFVFPSLEPLKHSILNYLSLMWWAVLLGLFIGGVIDAVVPQKWISYHLALRKKRTILKAVMFGFLMSVCSHGILAIAMEIYKKGASTAAVIAFLLASPWANLPLTILLIGFFGVKALFFVIGAIIIAIITGLIYQALERFHVVESNQTTDHAVTRESLPSISLKSITQESIRAFPKKVALGSWHLSQMVLGWVLLGIILAAATNAYVPKEYFDLYMGDNFKGLWMSLGLATVLEVCSEGTAPLAFEIYRMTGAFGNAFVFLMAGVVTDYTEIGLIWKNIGRKAALLLPVITVPQVILLGVLANYWFN